MCLIKITKETSVKDKDPSDLDPQRINQLGYEAIAKVFGEEAAAYDAAFCLRERLGMLTRDEKARLNSVEAQLQMRLVSKRRNTPELHGNVSLTYAEFQDLWESTNRILYTAPSVPPPSP